MSPNSRTEISRNRRWSEISIGDVAIIIWRWTGRGAIGQRNMQQTDLALPHWKFITVHMVNSAADKLGWHTNTLKTEEGERSGAAPHQLHLSFLGQN